ncbi:WcaF family extracellular polysaccharide biosynthesis acetyltransferase [Actinomycetota bacterium]
MATQDLSRFAPSLDRGRPRYVEAVWHVMNALFFQSALPWPSALKRAILRLFGASVGTGVVIRSRTTIHMPWKLTIGDNSWIGFDCFLLNLEPIVIGTNCAISHRVFLCTGNHDYRSATFDYVGAPISLQDEVWVGSQTFVGPGVTVNSRAVISAGSVVLADQPTGMVCSGNPCTPQRERAGGRARPGDSAGTAP